MGRLPIRCRPTHAPSQLQTTERREIRVDSVLKTRIKPDLIRQRAELTLQVIRRLGHHYRQAGLDGAPYEKQGQWSNGSPQPNQKQESLRC